MQHRPFGNSGTIVSPFALGTPTLGAEADEPASHALLDTYVEAGGNFSDTADVYSAGVSEEYIGRWLAVHPTEREELVIATKGLVGADRRPEPPVALLRRLMIGAR